MGKYKISIKLMTEAIFGSGYSIPGTVDLEIVCDKYGLPYMKGKTFKGNFRDVMKDVVALTNTHNSVLDKLLGKENDGIASQDELKFSDCTIAKNIKDILICGEKLNKYSADEVKEALTDIRSFTSIDENGAYRKGSLRQYRVIKKGLKFEVFINCNRDLSDDELRLMAITTSMMRHIGTMRTRGKGEINCIFEVYKNGTYIDMTDDLINSFIQKGGVINV